MGSIVFAGGIRIPSQGQVAQAEFDMSLSALARLLARENPDVVVVFGDGAYGPFKPDWVQQFAIVVSDFALAKSEGFEQEQERPVPLETAEYLLCSLVKDHNVDMAFCEQVTLGLPFFTAFRCSEKVPVLPFLINSSKPPTPSVFRCDYVGAAIAAVIGRRDANERVALLSVDAGGEPMLNWAVMAAATGQQGKKMRQGVYMHQVSLG